MSLHPELVLIKVGVDTVFGQQLVVSAPFLDAVVVDDDDLIGVFDGGQTVGDDQAGTAFGQLFQ